MKDILIYSLACVLLIADAVCESRSFLFAPAAIFGVIALMSAHLSGKGKILEEDELPKTPYHVVYEMKRQGRTIVAVLTKEGKIRICMSKGAEFTQFKLWGDRDHHRLLTPVGKTT